MANGTMRAEKGTDRLWYYLSANEFLPVLRATLEERVHQWMPKSIIGSYLLLLEAVRQVIVHKTKVLIRTQPPCKTLLAAPLQLHCKTTPGDQTWWRVFSDHCEQVSEISA